MSAKLSKEGPVMDGGRPLVTTPHGEIIDPSKLPPLKETPASESTNKQPDEPTEE